MSKPHMEHRLLLTPQHDIFSMILADVKKHIPLKLVMDSALGVHLFC